MSRVLSIIGFITFALGLTLAIIAGMVAPTNPTVILVLVLLGIIIGLLNIAVKEIVPLLLAVVALVVIGGVFEPIKIVGVGVILDNMLRLVATLMAPAAVIVAIRTLVAVGFPPKD